MQINKIIFNFMNVIILGILFNLFQKKLGIDLNSIFPQDLIEKIPINLVDNQNALYFIIFLIVTTLISLNKTRKENEEDMKKVE